MARRRSRRGAAAAAAIQLVVLVGGIIALNTEPGRAAVTAWIEGGVAAMESPIEWYVDRIPDSVSDDQGPDDGSTTSLPAATTTTEVPR